MYIDKSGSCIVIIALYVDLAIAPRCERVCGCESPKASARGVYKSGKLPQKYYVNWILSRLRGTIRRFRDGTGRTSDEARADGKKDEDSLSELRREYNWQPLLSPASNNYLDTIDDELFINVIFTTLVLISDRKEVYDICDFNHVVREFRKHKSDFVEGISVIFALIILHILLLLRFS